MPEFPLRHRPGRAQARHQTDRRERQSRTTLLGRLFRLVSRLRGRRSLHPVGDGYRGRLLVTGDPDQWADTPLLARSRVHDALVRCSRAAGLPEPLPDVLGIAVKLPGAHGPGLDQDLLFSSAVTRPWLPGMLVPRRSFLRGVFSTLLPYRLGRRGRRILWLRPVTPAPPIAPGRPLVQLELAVDGPSGAAYELWTGGVLRRPRRVGRLDLLEPLPADQAELLRFNPWTTGPGLAPAGWVNRLRRATYGASQEGWLPRTRRRRGHLRSVP